jgi:O-antigen/teichoic acid export membrane protein
VTPAPLRTYIYAASGAWGGAGLQFIAGVILVRSLAPQDVGTFVFATAIAAFVFGVFDIRIEEGLTQFLIREQNVPRQVRTKSALRFAVSVDVVSGLIIFALTLVALTLLPLHLSDQTRNVSAIAALTNLVGIADGSLLAVLYAQHAFGWLSAYQIVLNGARCLTLLAVPIAAPSDAAWAFALAQVVGTAFALTIIGIRFLPRGGHFERLDSTDRRWLLGFSIHVAAASAVATIRATATPLVMGVVGTKQQVANARVAESPTKLLGVAAAPLRTVLFPRLSAAWARRDRADARRLIRHYVASTLVIVGAFGVAMAIAIDFLLTTIYGPAYGGLRRVGQFFVLAALLDAVAGWQKVAPAALDRPWLRTFILIGESTALLIALLFFVPTHGPLGAAMSASIAAATSLAMGTYWLRPAFAESNWREHRQPVRSAEEAEAFVERHPG